MVNARSDILRQYQDLAVWLVLDQVELYFCDEGNSTGAPIYCCISINIEGQGASLNAMEE
jgi:hypothetical protein